MEKIFAVVILLSSVSLFAQDSKSNPDDYKLDVHVRASRLVTNCGEVHQGSSFCWPNQELKVEIHGKTYDLTSGTLYSGSALLRTGNYKGRIVKESTRQSYEYTRTYELLFPGGGTRKYTVTGEYE